MPLCICEAPAAKTDPVPKQVWFFYNYLDPSVINGGNLFNPSCNR
jgi:hypothetical protein